ncbi:MAG: hypothetical protein D6815_06845 [Candidatus Dadabacteria bacterium]|nr:MAG: hypothetical protein D6815_06845 [Candidatus Dadabacteria bacterium]
MIVSLFTRRLLLSRRRTGSIRHRLAQRSLPLWALGGLGDREDRILGAHLRAGCAECETLLCGYRHAAAELAELVSARTPSKLASARTKRQARGEAYPPPAAI